MTRQQTPTPTPKAVVAHPPASERGSMSKRIAFLTASEGVEEVELTKPWQAAVDAGLDEATVADLSRWPTSPQFGTRERACLAFVEQWIIDVASVSDEQAAAVAEVLGPDQLAGFAAAVLVLEQRQRLRLAWSRLFTSEEVS